MTSFWTFIATACRQPLRRLLLACGLVIYSSLAGAAGVELTGNYPGYISFGPSLIVNLASTGRPKFLRVDVELYVMTAADGGAVNNNLPAIRDRLISLLGGRDMETLRDIESREELRNEALTAIQETLQQYAMRPAISDLFFTGFIMQ